MERGIITIGLTCVVVASHANPWLLALPAFVVTSNLNTSGTLFVDSLLSFGSLSKHDLPNAQYELGCEHAWRFPTPGVRQLALSWDQMVAAPGRRT
jgi:hypothetical protein